MTVPITEPSHYVLAACAAWGHTRPFCTLASRMAKSRPIVLTFFTTRPFYERVENEISRNFTTAENEIRARIRIVALVSNEENIFDMVSLNASFADCYTKLAQKQPVVCAQTQAQAPAVSAPAATIFDVFAFAMANAVREISKQSVKVYGWVPISAASGYYLFGPAGGFSADTTRLVREEMERSGRSLDEVAGEMFCKTKGRIVDIPGIPKMYDYEHSPQQSLTSRNSVGGLQLGAVDHITSCDGALILSSHCFEPAESIKALKLWFEERSCKTYMIGPMLASGAEASQKEKLQSSKSSEIHEFMDHALQTNGPKSMLYISFGSFFWPPEPERFWTFLDVLFEKKIPFVVSHAASFAQIPDYIQEKAKASDHALFSPWSPQQFILSHPATGWFVTHCGWNSVVESMSAGVPMICWPYQADQGINTTHLTDNINVAYELTEVRTGNGLRPVYRTGKTPTATMDSIRDEAQRVLELAFGADGAKKRENVQKLKESIGSLWDEEGASRRELENFLDHACSVKA